MKRPHVVEVVAVLEPPSSYDEALALRAKLIDDVHALQDGLSSRGEPDWRSMALTELRRKQSLLRQLKEWLRRNDAVKSSEWTLLGQCHQFLEEVAGCVGKGNALDAEREAILDAIELAVPAQYINRVYRYEEKKP